MLMIFLLFKNTLENTRTCCIVSKQWNPTTSIGEPKVYLRADVGKLLYCDGNYAWKMSPDSHVEEAINKVKKRLKLYGLEYNKNISDVNYSLKNHF